MSFIARMLEEGFRPVLDPLAPHAPFKIDDQRIAYIQKTAVDTGRPFKLYPVPFAEAVRKLLLQKLGKPVRVVNILVYDEPALRNLLRRIIPGKQQIREVVRVGAVKQADISAVDIELVIRFRLEHIGGVEIIGKE